MAIHCRERAIGAITPQATGQSRHLGRMRATLKTMKEAAD
jgi:hypothetical protein